jgi:hypothetical protein
MIPFCKYLETKLQFLFHNRCAFQPPITQYYLHLAPKFLEAMWPPPARVFLRKKEKPGEKFEGRGGGKETPERLILKGNSKGTAKHVRGHANIKLN